MVSFTSQARAEDDTLASYRTRFRAGMDKYKEGNLAEAIQTWEPIYREMGPEKGYRLAFDLARAYQKLDEATHAAERYESFLSELERRRSRGDTMDPQVQRDDEEARQGLEELRTTKGRIKVTAGNPPILVHIDAMPSQGGGFEAYVAPGHHVVTFGDGTLGDRQEVTVNAGDVLEVSPSPLPDPSPWVAQVAPPKNTLEPARVIRTVRPFPKFFLFFAAGLTAASVAVPVLTYSNALAVEDSYGTESNPAQRKATYRDYQSAKTLAYRTLAVPIGLGAVTAALVTYYFAGSKAGSKAANALPPTVIAVTGGAVAQWEGRF